MALRDLVAAAVGRGSSPPPLETVDDPPRAIIDIGSNTVRLVIYGGPPRAPAILHNEKVTAKLGKGLAGEKASGEKASGEKASGEKAGGGKLGGKAMAAALAALARYAAMLRAAGIDDVETVATAAVRDASNGEVFLARVAALGLAPRLLSGEEEAVTSARGVLGAFPGVRGIVGDLGGGSLELIDVGGGEAGIDCRHGCSLPLGTLRLAALRAGGPAKFAGRVRKLLRGADCTGAQGQTLYLVGGSWRALARYAMHRQDWPVDDPHGFELTAEAALRLTRPLAARKRSPARPGVTPAEREAADRRRAAAIGISAGRLASLPDAAALLTVLVRQLGPARLVFSSWGLREGLLAMRFSPEVRASDPLLAGVATFVATQAAEIADQAALVCDWTAAANPAGIAAIATPPLRLAATMLALASMRVEPNLRADLASHWALGKRWIGIDGEGRAMLALALLANNGRTGIPPELLRLAPIGHLREAMGWGLAVRLARRLVGPAAAALAACRLRVEGAALVLSLRADFAPLASDAVTRDLRALAESLGLEARLEVLPEGAG